MSLTAASGVTETCPKAEPLPVGSECLFGQCQRNGSSADVVCMDTCEVMGRDTCNCTCEWATHVGVGVK